MNKPKRILQILIKNTSTLDFTLPIFHSLSDTHQKNITVLVWYWNLENFFREANGYVEVLESLEIDIVCLNDFCPKWMKFVLLKITNKSDRRSRKELRFFSSLSSSLKSVAKWFLENLVERIAHRFIDVQSIFDYYEPEIIFYDIRKDNGFILSKKLKKILVEGDWKIYYAPHAPHMRTAEGDYCDFDQKIPLPSNAICLYANSNAKPWSLVPNNKQQFLNVGYPGFNNKWGDFLHQQSEALVPVIIPRVLYIGRRFLSPGISNNDFDIYTLTYSETLHHLKQVKKSAQSLFGEEFEVVIKPHPNANATLVKNLASEAGLRKYTISYGSAFSFVGKVDLVISEPSTVALIFGFFKVKTLIFQSDLQVSLEEKWDQLRELYSDFPRVHTHSDVISYYQDSEIDFMLVECQKKIVAQYSHKKTESFINFLKGQHEFI